MDDKQLVVSWLNDAYAMENALIPILENHAKDAKEHPKVQSRIQQHLEATRRHAEKVQKCIEDFGESPSTTKSTVGKIFGTVQSVSTAGASDQLVKNGIADFAAEHFEIASYKALIAAAEQFGHSNVSQVCQEILRDEEDMARWLEQELPQAVRSYSQEAARR